MTIQRMIYSASNMQLAGFHRLLHSENGQEYLAFFVGVDLVKKCATLKFFGIKSGEISGKKAVVKNEIKAVLDSHKNIKIITIIDLVEKKIFTNSNSIKLAIYNSSLKCCERYSIHPIGTSAATHAIIDGRFANIEQNFDLLEISDKKPKRRCILV